MISPMKRLLFFVTLITALACDTIKPDDGSDINKPGDAIEDYGDFKLTEGTIFMTEEMT